MCFPEGEVSLVQRFMQAAACTYCRKKVKLIILVGSASKLAERAMQKPCQVGGVNNPNGSTTMLDDSRID